MKLPAIKAVLGQYRHTETGVITQEMIEAAWTELANAEDRFRRDLTPNAQLEWHMAEAHWHILRARDVIYGTWNTEPVKRGYRIRMGLDRINTLLFIIQRRNRKKQL